jgi:hypothetical protein
MKAVFIATLLVIAATFVNGASIEKETTGEVMNDTSGVDDIQIEGDKEINVSGDSIEFWELDEVVHPAYPTQAAEAVIASFAAEADPLESVHAVQQDVQAKESGAAEFPAEIDSPQDDVLASPESKFPYTDIKETQPIQPQTDKNRKDDEVTDIIGSIKRLINKIRGIEN